MSCWNPVFQIGSVNAFWFLVAYLLILIVQPNLYPESREIIKRLTFHPGKTLIGKVIGKITFLLYLGGMIYTIFLPLTISTIWFWIGLVIFIISMTVYMIAIHNYATTPFGVPVTKGIYNISRNPIHFFSYIAWIGIGIAATSWILILATLLQIIGMHPGTLAEECFCLEKYDDSYKKYMSRVPRYFLF